MQPATKPRKRSLWKKTLLGLAGVVALLVLYHFWITYRYEQQLQTLISQITAEDPHWDWDAMLSQLNTLQAKDNAAIEVVELLQLTTLRETIPLVSRNEWGKAYSQLYVKDLFHWYEEFLSLHPNARLPEAMREKMQPLMEMAPMAEVIQRARALRRFRSGRFAHIIKPTLTLSLLPDVQGARSISNLLAWDADLLILQKKLPEVVESIQGMLGVARSFSHDPFLISQLVRQSVVNQAGKQTMRLMALPVPWTPAALMTLQNDFEQEHDLTGNILQRMIRSDRAVMDHDLQALIDSKITYTEMARTYGRRVAWSFGVAKIDEVLYNLFPEMVLGWGNRPGNLIKERYELLQYYTAAVNWSKSPEHQLLSRLDAWKSTEPCLTPFLREFFMFSRRYLTGQPPLPEVTQLRGIASAFLFNRARLRCIISLLACERFRLEHGTWPTQWDVLVPKYLKQIPVDPYNGQPMLLKVLKDGLVVYAVGENGTDDGGNVETVPPTDVGYRLWNVTERGINLDAKCKEFVDSKKEE